MATRIPKTLGKTPLRVPASRPRTPLVAAAMKRAAGPHRKSEGATRVADRTALRRALQQKTERPDD